MAQDTEIAGLPIERFHIGGWVDAAFAASDVDGEGSNLSIHHMSLFADLRFNPRWQLFIEGEHEYRPEVGTLEREQEFELEQAYLEYTWSDAAQVRVGRFSNPFGYVTPVHWTINMDTIVGPLFEERGFIAEQQLGTSLSGRFFPAALRRFELETDYTAWVGYGSEALQSEDLRGWSYGGDLRVGSPGRGFLGVSLSRESRIRGGRANNGVLYGELNLPKGLTLRGEYFIRKLKESGVAEDYVRSLYGKARWQYRDWSLNYRFELSDDPDLGRRAAQRIHRYTVGYAFDPRVKLRFEYARHRTQSTPLPNFNTYGVWLGVFF